MEDSSTASFDVEPEEEKNIRVKSENSTEVNNNYHLQQLTTKEITDKTNNNINNNSSIIKSTSDLRSSKTELFNKLISSQSQQIVTTPTSGIRGNNKNKADLLYRANSLNAHGTKKHQQTTTNYNNSNKTPGTVASGTSSTTTGTTTTGTTNQNQQLSIDDTKQGPVVFTRSRNRWYTNEEVAAILTNFSSHPEWQTNELQVRPKSGAVLLYSREKVRYRQDGYCWKKRKNGRTTREDHMKLKVQGIECIYGCYVHSAILPTFHRRCYWLLQNPDIVLVHYLNQPPDDQNKMMITFNSTLLEADTRRTWTNEEIIEEIGSVFGGISQIQHTLNMNFPPQSTTTATIIHTNQPQEHTSSSSGQNQTIKITEIERMIESSPKSQINTNSPNPASALNDNTNNEQVNMTIIDNSQQSTTEEHHFDNNHNNNITSRIVSKQETYNDDEIMTNLSGKPDNDISNLDNGCLKQKNLEEDDTTRMTFDIVNEFSADVKNNNNVDNNNNNNDQQQEHKNLAFVVNAYSNSSTNNNNILDQNSNLSLGGGQQQQPEQMEPCSPVTQIYNKIVDDIETYALPLEPNQFNSGHHHHHHHHHSHNYQQHNLSISSPVQTMDIVNETEEHGRRLNQQTQQQLVDSGSLHHNQHLHNQLLNDGVEQYSGNNDNSTNDIVKDHTTCSMDLTGCDLFNDHQHLSNRDGVQSDHCEIDEDSENLLLGEFKLQSHHQENVNHNRSQQIETQSGIGGTVDSLSNVENLPDLMMSNNCGNVVDDSSLLVDSNSLDLFSFKPIDCDTQIMQQIDVKSSTSDTDALTRLSPMLLGSVPRCNSTGNAMQPSHLNSNHHHHHHHHSQQQQQQQHFSSHFLSSITDHISTMPDNTFGNFQTVTYNDDNDKNNITCNNSQRSSSTNPSNSTSCSLNSLQRCATTTISSTNTAPCNNIVLNESSTVAPTSSSFIKLPLQQRQRSEQQEPTNSVLNSLLPKALSLDCGDLSITNHQQQNQYHRHHRLSTSPLTGYETISNPNHDLLVIPSTINTQQPSQQTIRNQQCINNLSFNVQNEQSDINSSVLATNTNAGTIPLENSSEILVNTSSSYQSYSNLNQNQTLTESFDYNNSCNMPTTNDREVLLPILDYVPNWCNITGGAKVLIVGNWSSLLVNSNNNNNNNNDCSLDNSDQKEKDNKSFSAMFDDLIVPATLIQENVLRCYVPSHEQGFISLKVLYMDCVVSEQVLFEMRPSCSNQQSLIQIRESSSSSLPHQLGNGGTSSGTSRVDSISSDKSNNNICNINTHHHHLISNSTSPFMNQKHQLYHETGGAGASSSGKSENNYKTNNKVLTLAENIINAMHRKNNHTRLHATESRLVNSLDIEMLDQYQNRHLYHHSNNQRRSLKDAQRRSTGSRSLSRDSEPAGCGSGYTMNSGLMENNPYWHLNPVEMVVPDSMQQPLSVVTNFKSFDQLSNRQANSCGSGGNAITNYQTKVGSNNYLGQHNQSAFIPYVVQRPNLSLNTSTKVHQQPLEQQYYTETSSSGLGSIVSSLSPSPSSLHSPTSVCCTNGSAKHDQDNQSPCSCERQSSSTPTSADFCEYFQASAKTERSFASLTLNDCEQQELYEAAKIIQKAYRTYRGRKRQASEFMIENSSVALQNNQLNHPQISCPSSMQLSSIGGALSNPQQPDQQQKSCLNYQTNLRVVSNVHPQNQQQINSNSCYQTPGHTLIKCYRDKEMQAATIIQAYYRRYRQYVHFKQQQNKTNPTLPSTTAQQASSHTMSNPCCNHRLVVDTMPVIIDKAITSHVDRKRFKTATLCTNSNNQQYAKVNVTNEGN